MPVQCTCQQCGAAFTTVPAYIKRGGGKFCSKPCQGAARRNRVAHQCERCGSAFEIKASQSRQYPNRYCSKPCYDAARSEGAWIDGICDACGQTFSFRRGVQRRFCSKACFRQSFGDGGAPHGRQHGNWRNGNAEGQLSYGPSWPRARQAARERDGRCVDCGKTPGEFGRALDVHHVVPFRSFGFERHREANALTNLVSVCRPCHRQRDRHLIGPGRRRAHVE